MAGDEHKQAPRAARGDDRVHDRWLARLPDDVLADVLRRVPPRWLAAASCVCKDWRDVVDSRRLLRSDLLPLSLAGLFIHFENHKYPEYVARPSSTVSGDLSFLPSASPECGDIWKEGVDFYDYEILDHCNGLLLLTGNYVVNPVTRQWYTLPTCPSEHPRRGLWYFEYLVYDPMISPCFEVFSVPTLDDYLPGDEKVDYPMDGSEWPPSLCKMYVFSSKLGLWEEKDFMREGDAAGTVAELRAGCNNSGAIYFRGALYIHCGDDFLMRVSLSNNTYIAFKPPMDLKAEGNLKTRIARSEKGVYFLALYKCWIRVWIFNESSGQMEWMLKHDKNLPRHRVDQRVHAPWILEDINHKLFVSSRDNNKPPTREIIEWNSDNDDGVENEDKAQHCESEYHNDFYKDIEILGFHPYKEIVFLSELAQTALAYHLKVWKIEILGNIYPKKYYVFKEPMYGPDKFTSFPYTPCWTEEF